MARILIADDDQSIRDVINAICELDHHEMRLCTDAADAVTNYLDFHPDLMILDVNMPGGGCEEVVARLRARTSARLCPWIVVTGLARVLDEDESARLGAVAIVAKPFEIQTLRQTVTDALRGSAAR